LGSNDHPINTIHYKYMGVERHRDLITNEHIKIGSNSYEKVKTFIDKSKFYSGGNERQI
jgi:hypothetical protein